MTQLSPHSFDEKKAAEVAYFFLSRAARQRMNITKLRLVKWIYLAERLSYARYGEPLVGDQLSSMRHGPVVSTTLELMEHPERVEHAAGAWDCVIAIEKDHDRHHYVVVSNACPYASENDLLSLSDSEIDLLDSVWSGYGRMSSKQLEDLLHDPQQFPEWRWREGDRSNPIELEELLGILGYGPDQVRAVVEKLLSTQAVRQAFAR